MLKGSRVLTAIRGRQVRKGWRAVPFSQEDVQDFFWMVGYSHLKTSTFVSDLQNSGMTPVANNLRLLIIPHYSSFGETRSLYIV